MKIRIELTKNETLSALEVSENLVGHINPNGFDMKKIRMCKEKVITDSIGEKNFELRTGIISIKDNTIEIDLKEEFFTMCATLIKDVFSQFIPMAVLAKNFIVGRAKAFTDMYNKNFPDNKKYFVGHTHSDEVDMDVSYVASVDKFNNINIPVIHYTSKHEPIARYLAMTDAKRIIDSKSDIKYIESYDLACATMDKENYDIRHSRFEKDYSKEEDPDENTDIVGDEISSVYEEEILKNVKN